MGTKKGNEFHKRSKEELNNFIKKLELQALETAEERLPLYLEVGLKDANMILDVGCGSGMVTRDIARLTKGKVIGIDGSKDMIVVAKKVLKDYDNIENQTMAVNFTGPSIQRLMLSLPVKQLEKREEIHISAENSDISLYEQGWKPR